MTGLPSASDAPRPRLLTAADLCQLLNVSKSTVAYWRDRGELEAVPLPRGGWRYPSSQPAVQRALRALGLGAEPAR